MLTSALAIIALLLGVGFAAAQQFGIAAEGKAMLEKAVATLKADEVLGIGPDGHRSRGPSKFVPHR